MSPEVLLGERLFSCPGVLLKCPCGRTSKKNFVIYRLDLQAGEIVEPDAFFLSFLKKAQNPLYPVLQLPAGLSHKVASR